MSSQESAEAKALSEATEALAAEVADLSALEPQIASKLAVAHDQLAHVNPVSVEQVNAVAALAHTLGGLTADLKTAAGAQPVAPAVQITGATGGLVTPEPAPSPEPVAETVSATGGVAEPPAVAPASTEGEPAASEAVPPAQ